MTSRIFQELFNSKAFKTKNKLYPKNNESLSENKLKEQENETKLLIDTSTLLCLSVTLEVISQLFSPSQRT